MKTKHKKVYTFTKDEVIKALGIKEDVAHMFWYSTEQTLDVEVNTTE